MNSSQFTGDESLIAQVVDEFTDNCHRGHPPDLDRYYQRHPELKSLLQQILPAIQALAERNRPAGPVLSPGPVTPRNLDETRFFDSSSPHDSCESGAARRPNTPAIVELPDYEDLTEIGAGGMGVVFRARHRRLDRLVALKLLRGGPGANTELLQRFQAEARSLARVKHPQIVQIYEVGECNAGPYIALEYCSGGNLAERAENEPQLPRYAAELIGRLARGIQAAHNAGLIHRDLKPGNILFTEDGVPKIVDFGLAKQLDVDQDQTHTGAILGTPSYMAPEQALGATRELTPAVDIFALGAILYELLVGRPPFKGPSVLDTLIQVRTADPVAPRQLQPGLPLDLETICLKCLHKEPGARYRSAADLADDLDRFLNGLPVVARPVGPGERATRWVRRNPVIAGLLMTIFLSLSVGLAGMTWLYREAQAQTFQAQQNESIAKNNENEAERETTPVVRSPRE